MAVEGYAEQFSKRDVEIDNDEYNVGPTPGAAGADSGPEPPESYGVEV